MNLYNSIPKLIASEELGLCIFYKFCPKRFCEEESEEIRRTCLMIEKEIYNESCFESQEIYEDYIEEEIE